MTPLPDGGASVLAAPAPERSPAEDTAMRAGRREPLLSRPVRWVVAGLALVALLERFALMGRSLTVLDRMFIPDDTYYTLSIAKSIADGTGPSADGGETLTTGFQPLIAFLTVPAHWFSDDPGVPVRAVLAVLSLADVASVVLLALLAARVAGGAAAIAAAALWALSPLPAAIAMNGLEASLAVALSLAVVEAWCRARERQTWPWWLLVGVLAGLCLLARVDTVFLLGALGVLQLLSRQLRGLAVAVGTALVVVLPWWVVSIAISGSPVPESGGAVGELVDFHRSTGLSVPESLGLAAGRLLGTPVFDLPDTREWLRTSAGWAVTIAVLLCLLMVAAGAWWALSGRRRPAVSTLPMLALGIHGAALLLFYGLVNAAPWFYDRYLLPAVAVVVLAAATAFGWLWQRAVGTAADGRPLPGRAVARPVTAVALAGALALLVAAVVGTSDLHTRQPDSSVAGGYDGAKGYAEIARDLLARLPDGAVLGSLQSGALGYFAQYDDRGITVVNLDGVVDSGAAEALAEHRLTDYARERGVTHFADWDVNGYLFLERSDRSVGPEPFFEQLYTAPAQGEDAFELFRFVWPPLPGE